MSGAVIRDGRWLAIVLATRRICAIIRHERHLYSIEITPSYSRAAARWREHDAGLQ